MYPFSSDLFIHSFTQFIQVHQQPEQQHDGLLVPVDHRTCGDSTPKIPQASKLDQFLFLL